MSVIHGSDNFRKNSEQGSLTLFYPQNQRDLRQLYHPLFKRIK